MIKLKWESRYHMLAEIAKEKGVEKNLVDTSWGMRGNIYWTNYVYNDEEIEIVAGYSHGRLGEVTVMVRGVVVYKDQQTFASGWEGHAEQLGENLFRGHRSQM